MLENVTPWDCIPIKLSVHSMNRGPGEVEVTCQLTNREVWIRPSLVTGLIGDIFGNSAVGETDTGIYGKMTNFR